MWASLAQTNSSDKGKYLVIPFELTVNTTMRVMMELVLRDGQFSAENDGMWECDELGKLRAVIVKKIAHEDGDQGIRYEGYHEGSTWDTAR
jgi:hypothetical protein